MKDAINESDSQHEARIKGAADDSVSRVPTFVVELEPISEIVKPILGKVKSGTIIEIGVEFMDHGFVTKDEEKTGDEGKM
ncbi:hypothetical protein V6N13_122694 [Hibiscus sabdariffa]